MILEDLSPGTQRTYWKTVNECGLCWLGPCICHKMLYSPPKQEVIPAGKDEHMAPCDALLVRAKTVAFIMDLRDCYVEERSRSLSNVEARNWWDSHYHERHKIEILKPSIGWRRVLRIAK